MSKSISAYRGSLDLYYQVEDASGNFGEVYNGGNVTNFEIIPDAEEMEVVSTANADYGQAADTMIDAKPSKASFSVNRMNIDNWAVAFMGEIAARTGSSDSVVDEEVTAVLGGMFKLAALDVSAVVVKNSGGTVTYDAGDDYEVVDPALGIIKVLKTGDISDGDILKVSYTKEAEAGWLLSGGTKPSKFLRVWGRGLNRFNNKRCLVNIPRGSVKPSGGFSLVGTEPAAIGFDMTMVVPADGSAPYTIITDE